MDYTEAYNATREMALAQGVSEEQYDRHETLFYDETDNVKHLVMLPSKKVNAAENTCFVLGGIQAETTISDDELHTVLGKTPGKELKSTKDLRGTFVDILRKENISRVLNLIDDKGWHIHFIMVQVWYYAFVDIIDSICDDVEMAFPYKAILYKILKSSPSETVELLGRYHYPDVKMEEQKRFIEELYDMVEKYFNTTTNIMERIMILMLMEELENAKDKELTFIQDEDEGEWVKAFVQFYSAEIYSYPNKTLILDMEKQVENALWDDIIEVDGDILLNYSFEDSASNPMIQVCDYVVSILRKYFIFLDQNMNIIETEISGFDEQQLNNFKLLNKVMKQSLDYNPLFFHYIASVETQSIANMMMEKYGN